MNKNLVMKYDDLKKTCIAMALLMAGPVYAGNIFDELEKELDEINRNNQGYQSLLDDLDEAGNSDSSGKGRVHIRSDDSVGGAGDDAVASQQNGEKAQQEKISTPDKNNKDEKRNLEKEPEEADQDIRVLAPGIYRVNCDNGSTAVIAARDILVRGDDAVAVSNYKNSVMNKIASACSGFSTVRKRTIFESIIDYTGRWVHKKMQECLQRNKGKEYICEGYRRRAPGGVRG